VYRPLQAGGQFPANLWGPLVDPSDERTAQVWSRIGQGLSHTLIAAVLAIAASLVLGTAVAVVIITIFFVGHTLPAFGVENALWYVVGGLTLYNMVVLAEILRSGMEGQATGQREAAAAIGLTSFQATRMVLLPQAFRTMLPALISQMVVILKDTSLGFVTSYEELMNVAKQIISVLGNPIQLYFVVGTMFILVNYSLSRLTRFAQRRLSRSRDKPRLTSPVRIEPAEAEPPAAAFSQRPRPAVTLGSRPAPYATV